MGKNQAYAAYMRLTSALRKHTNWKMKGRKKVFQENGNQKKAEVAKAILILDKVEFKPKTKEIINKKKGDIFWQQKQNRECFAQLNKTKEYWYKAINLGGSIATDIIQT